nr:copia protein [Tanacetum cinerariifolium]
MLQNTDGDVAFDEKEPEFDGRKPNAQSKKHDDKTKREAKCKSLVESLIVYRNLSAEFEDFFDNNINEDNAAGTLVLAVGKLSPNSTNTFSAAGPSKAIASPTQGKSSCIDTSQLPKDPNMLELEDITYSDDEDDVGAEADFNNLETSITFSPIPTTRVHKDHPMTQIIGTKWVVRNKKDERGVVVRNKARLVAQGHTQEEGINYEGVFAPVARIEAIRLFLAYASFMGFMVYQMDIKSAFLYGTIKEEVYVCQPLRFKDPNYPDKVYKVVKALYGLHQAPRAWVETPLFEGMLVAGENVEEGIATEHVQDDADVAAAQEGVTTAIKEDVQEQSIPSPTPLPQSHQDLNLLHHHLLSHNHKLLTSHSVFFKQQLILVLPLLAELSRVNTPRCDEDRLELMELMAYFTAVRSKVSAVWSNELVTFVAVKKVNDVTRLQALVDKKKVVITEATLRDALRLEDAEGIKCLPNEEIFTELARMGYEKPSTKLTFYKAQEERIDYDEVFAPVARIEAIRIFLALVSFMRTASTPIETQKPLVKDEEATDVDVHLYRSMIGSLMYLIASRPDIMFAVCACSRFQVTPKISHLHAVKRIFRRLISWQCKKQTIIATSTAEVDISPTIYASNIKQFWNTATSQTINDEKKIHAKVDGKTVDGMEHDIELTDHVPQTPYDSPLSRGHTPGTDKASMTLKALMDLCTTLLHKLLDLENFKTAQRAGTSKRHSLGRRKVSKQGRKKLKLQKMFQGGSTAEIVSTARPDISVARPKVSTAEPKTPPTTTTLFDDEDVTIDDTLVKMKNLKAKEKGIAFKDADDSTRPIKSITTLQPLPTIDPKDKVQIDAGHELAVRLTHEEQDKYTVEERSNLLAKFFKRRKKQLAKERAEAIRRKPPTKTQLINLMMTYLKHTDRFTHTQLKCRSFEDIQKLYIEEQKWVDAFVLIRSEEDKKRIGSRKKRAVGSSSKHKSPKKQKVNDKDSKDGDKEHRKCLKVVPDDDKSIDYETLDVKSVIVDYEMLKVLDRQDVLDLHKIIMERFPANDPEGRFTHSQLESRSFEEIQKLYVKEQKWVDAFIPIGFEEDEKRVRSRKK